MKVDKIEQGFNVRIKTLPASNVDSNLVYILIKSDQVVYVGVSSVLSLGGRIKSHLRDKDFDSYAVFNENMDRQTALLLESMLISFVQPEYNIKIHEQEVALQLAISSIIGSSLIFRDNSIEIEINENKSWATMIQYDKQSLPTPDEKERFISFKKAWRGWYIQSNLDSVSPETRKLNQLRYNTGKEYLESLGYKINEIDKDHVKIKKPVDLNV